MRLFKNKCEYIGGVALSLKKKYYVCPLKKSI